MKLEPLMKELAKDLEIEGDFATEVPGVFVIPLDEGLNLTISTLPRGGVSLRSTLIEAPRENLETYFTEVLRANLFGEGTHGAILGLNDSGNQLTLSQEMDYDMDFKEFQDTIEDFINSVDFWRDVTKTYT